MPVPVAVTLLRSDRFAFAVNHRSPVRVLVTYAGAKFGSDA
jgi:hypothetical protein